MDRRKALLKVLLIGASLFVCGSATYLVLSFALKAFFPSPWLSNSAFLLFVTTGVCTLLFRSIDLFWTEIFKHYFFKKHSYPHMVLMNLAEELELVLDLQEFGNLVVNTFGELLSLKTVVLVMGSEEGEEYRIASAFGWNVSDYRRVYLRQDSSLIRHLAESGAHVLVRDRFVKALDWQDANRLSHDLDLMRANWIIPLIVKEKLAGFLAFSAIQPDRTFDESDFHFFRKFARSISAKAFNALRFSEAKQRNEELKDSQSRLMQMTKLTAIEHLATGLAHQIHNPLTIISGKAQVLLLQKDRIALDERVQEVLKTIVKQTKRAADITKKLLMFSQSSGAARESLNLTQILEDTLALVSYQVSLETIEVIKSVDDDLPALHGNLQEMREVFLNLILNAVQSIGGRQGKISIRIAYKESEDIIQLQVADTGRGIPEEHIEKLFNPFFTTRQDALGLGLFVTKQIVHRMGGSIRVESRSAEGSLFMVSFPCQTPVTMTKSIKEYIAS